MADVLAALKSLFPDKDDAELMDHWKEDKAMFPSASDDALLARVAEAKQRGVEPQRIQEAIAASRSAPGQGDVDRYQAVRDYVVKTRGETPRMKETGGSLLAKGIAGWADARSMGTGGKTDFMGRVRESQRQGYQDEVAGRKDTEKSVESEMQRQLAREKLDAMLGVQGIKAESAARKEEAKAEVKQNAPPKEKATPPGYRWTSEGNLEAIPGGPAEAKIEEKETKKAGLAASRREQAKLVIGKVDDALKKVGISSAGVGAAMRSIPGSSAKDLENDINTIKANLGFEELQKMRSNSPTGGALGQVAVQELTMLQSTVAALDQEQSPAQLRRNLVSIREHYNKWLATLEPSKEQAPGEVRRKTKDGRIAVFDEATKQFVRYE